LAIELAAARIRLLDPPALLDRLVSSLDALGTGAVDLPERQRTLRATVEWSVGLLEDPERSLLEVAAAFADGDPDRAALLEGAAEGLRRRVGQPAWPHLRRVEADLVARVHRRLGGSRFDQAFSAGSGLTQRDAVAVVQNQRGTGTHRPSATTHK
jgi:hypothetical protein